MGNAFCVKFGNLRKNALNCNFLTISKDNDMGFSVLMFSLNDLQNGVKVRGKGHDLIFDLCVFQVF